VHCPYREVSGWSIHAIPMDTATGTRPVGAGKAKLTPGSRMEAAVVIRHGGTVWMFTSRGNWADCSYYTDVWRADTFWNGTFRRVRTIMTSASTAAAIRTCTDRCPRRRRVAGHLRLRLPPSCRRVGRENFHKRSANLRG